MGHPKFILKKSDKDTSQPYWFVLTAKNGKIITTSEMYSSKQVAENGIASVKENAPIAEVDDQA